MSASNAANNKFQLDLLDLFAKMWKAKLCSSDDANKLRETLCFPPFFFFSANGRTSPTQINCNEDEFLIFLPFSFSKLLQMSESLEPQLKQCPVWLWLHIPWKPNQKWGSSAQWRLISHNRPNRPSKFPLACIIALIFFLPHTESHCVSSASVSTSQWLECKSLQTGDNRAVRMSALCRWLSLQEQLWWMYS